jgi:hypothetical protein
MKKLQLKLFKIQNELIENRENLNKLYFRGAMDTIENILFDVNETIKKQEEHERVASEWLDGDGYGY